MVYPGVAQRMLPFAIWRRCRDEYEWEFGGLRDLAAAHCGPQAIAISRGETFSRFCE
jgi:hypothetical protein